MKRTPDPKTIAAARRAQAKLEKAAAQYEAATEARRQAFRAALDSGASLRGLAAELGLSPAAIQKVVTPR
jgi:hypothetical protein